MLFNTWGLSPTLANEPGNSGYLKRSAVIASMEVAGFVLDGESDINPNPADVPSES